MGVLRDLNKVRDVVRQGVDIADSIERQDMIRKSAQYNNAQRDLNREAADVNRYEAAYQAGANAASSNERYEAKLMNCPNCGATMKPSELVGRSGALASANCPYCGSQIVINDDVRNAQYIHEVELEKKRIDIEERRVKIEEDRAKSEDEFRKSQDTINTIKAVDKGVSVVSKFVVIAFIVFGIIFVIMLIFVLTFMSKVFGAMF